MSKPKSIKVNIKFVKSPDASRRVLQLAQLIARHPSDTSDTGKANRKEA